MENNTEYTERAYSTSEVAAMLDMAIPTVRKYSQELEKKGYVYIKSKRTGSHQARLYTEKDVTALRYFKELRANSHIKVDTAANIVIERFGKGAIQSIRGNDTQEITKYEEQYKEIKDMIHNQTEMINRQNELIKELTNRLDQQQEYIDRNLKERDGLLLNAIEERLETQRQIAAAEEEKKGFFARLFKK